MAAVAAAAATAAAPAPSFAAEPAQEQLQRELDESIYRAIATQRPILTHVNADTTWLVQLPIPQAELVPQGRKHFNILIDPWLTGPQSDVAAWFSTQWHLIPSSVQSIAELEERLGEVEAIADDVFRTQRLGNYRHRYSDRPSQIESTAKIAAQGTSLPAYIDAVAICHEFSDHCHEATLREIDPSVPIIATDKAAALIRSWKHFQRVYTAPSFGPDNPDWRAARIPALPDWLSISRIVSPGNALYYHSALLISATPASPLSTPDCGGKHWPKHGAEAIIYSPHGIAAADLAHLADAQPPLRTLALLHGLHDVSLPRFQLNLGAHNGLQAHRTTRPKYWVASHDEPKKGGGVVGFFLKRSVITLRDAVDRLRDAAGAGAGGAKGDKEDWMKDINFLDMQSGESLLLE